MSDAPSRNTRTLFRDAEIGAERLLGWLRAGVALALAGALAASVGPSLADPVPFLSIQHRLALLTCTSYLVAGLLAVALSRPRFFHPLLPWLFALADVGFILTSLALSLGNTGLTAAYLAALPSLWLLPLALAFGALRFESRIQVAQLLALVAGLLALAWMFGLERLTDRPETAATVAFFFWVPPNVMRLVMLALAGGVVVVATVRARQLLHRAVTEATMRAELTRFLPEEIAHRLDGPDAAALREGRQQMLSLLFVDIRGFTHLSETLPPTELNRLVTVFRREISGAAKAHGGIVDKFIGDGALLLFGVAPSETPPARQALACAREILNRLGADCAAAPRLRVGIGLHSGEVFCGLVGDERRVEFTVLGDPVNTTVRIEQVTREVNGDLVASADLLEAAGVTDRSGWRLLASHLLRGRERPIDLYVSCSTQEPAPPRGTARTPSA